MTSPLSRVLSPAGRVLALSILVTGVAFAAPSPGRAVATALLLVALLALSRPRPRWLARRAAAALPALGALVLPFFLMGEPDRGRDVALRAGLCLALCLVFAATMTLAELPAALLALRVPRPLALTIHTLLWQLEHVADEARRLLLARRLRGARGVFGPEVLSALLTRTAARAERVELAVALRGAGASGPSAGLRGRDWLGATAATGFAVLLGLGS